MTEISLLFMNYNYLSSAVTALGDMRLEGLALECQRYDTLVVSQGARPNTNMAQFTS